ncbi:MAG: ABC transporter substrate-binding protein, partial [Promethearchaeota archaeon]
MRGKVIARIAPVMVLCLVLVLLGSAEAAIKIGVIGPFTGPVAFNGEEMRKGVMLAVDEMNAKGGLFGQKIEIVFGDT